MLWIDGEYFAPLFFGSIQERMMIFENDANKLVLKLCDQILRERYINFVLKPKESISNRGEAVAVIDDSMNDNRRFICD